MADENVHHLHQSPKRPMTATERVRLHRQRKREAAANLPATIPVAPLPPQIETLQAVPAPFQATERRPAASYLLVIAALGLALVGIVMNGNYAASLGATPTAGYLFLAIGVAADLVALTLPTIAGRLWQNRERATAATAWAAWAVTFLFAVTAGIGFASVNISDVTLARAGRTTPAVTNANANLADAMRARDLECKGGVGKWCREREQAVADRRAAVDVAMASVAQASDPQAAAAIHLVAWASRGSVQPAENDFGMLRLFLLTLLPQLGGILLMVGRKA